MLPTNNKINVDVREDNISRLERMSAQEIIEEAEQIEREKFQNIPSVDSLIDSVADTESRKIYTSMNDVLSMWLHRYSKDQIKIPYMGWCEFSPV